MLYTYEMKKRYFNIAQHFFFHLLLFVLIFKLNNSKKTGLKLYFMLDMMKLALIFASFAE